MSVRRVLVPLAVVALAAALFFWRGGSGGPTYDVAGDVAECAARLRTIHGALLEYARKEGQPPPRSGVAFLGALFAAGLVQDAETLTCPGRFAGAVHPGVDYRLLDALGDEDSAYAGRDMVAHPLAKFPAGGSELEPIAACDNASGLNHDGCMNVLFSDGSVVTLTLAQEIELGHLPPDATNIQVGPESPIASLRKLSRQ